MEKFRFLLGKSFSCALQKKSLSNQLHPIVANDLVSKKLYINIGTVRKQLNWKRQKMLEKFENFLLCSLINTHLVNTNWKFSVLLII